MLNAVILAGDKGENGESKALIKITSKNMIDYIIEAMRSSGCVDKICVVGGSSLEEELKGSIDSFEAAGEGIMENMRRGIQKLGNLDRPCLVCTCDIPMVKGEAIRDFVERCESKGIELGYPIIDKRLNDVKYPEVKRTYVRMKEGTFTGGNIIYINPQIVDKLTEKVERLVDYRKKPFKMGRILGFIFLMKLISGRLSIASVERKAWETFGIKGEAITTDFPEIGNDVDKAEDIEFVNRYLNRVTSDK